MRAAIYLRVSTREQTTENQSRELREVAARHGHDVVDTYEDAGISGANGRDRPPEFDRLLRDATTRKFDVVMAWSVDRLGRSLQDLVSFLSEVHALGIDLYLHRQQLDTRTPSGRAMFGMLSVFATFEREMIVERVRAGMARARANGKHVGRPGLDSKLREEIKAALAAPGRPGVRAIARRFKVSPTTVQGISRESRGAERREDLDGGGRRDAKARRNFSSAQG
jgi:DNA invertase Pin-like site-specific DNA recombinase